MGRLILVFYCCFYVGRFLVFKCFVFEVVIFSGELERVWVRVGICGVRILF